MLLEKWYLDAVFPDGRVWYGYRARLRLGGCPALFWTAGCVVHPDGGETKSSRWKEWAEPTLQGGQWEWKGPDGFQARWRPSGPGVELALAADDRFQARWNCVAPRAAVTRTGGRGRETLTGQAVSHGVGYLEHLRLEVAGPGLPFRKLWWGRAHAGQSSMVWIRWGEGRELSLVLEDGVRVEGRIETLPQGGVRVRTSRSRWETGTGHPLCNRDTRGSFPRWLVWLTRGLAPARELKMAGSVRQSGATGELTGSGVWEEVEWP
jgi:hypothetical protein